MPKLHEFVGRKDYQLPILLGLVLLFLLIDIVRFSNNPTSAYFSSLYYFVGYDTGYGGRKLIGTIFSFILPEYVEMRHIRVVLLGVNLIMLVLFAIFICSRNRSGKDVQRLMAVSLLIYLVSPFPITVWCTSGLSVAFMETYMFVYTIIWLLLYMRCGRHWYYYLATVVIASCGILTHITFCCTFFPLFVALFIYDCFDANGLNWKRIVTYTAVCAGVFGVFLSIWLFGTMNVPIDELQASICKRAAPNVCIVDKEVIKWLYYVSNMENRNMAFAMFPVRYKELVVSMVLLLPLLAFFFLPWFMAFMRCTNRTTRWRYALVPTVLTLMVIPMFFMATDYGRWFVAWDFDIFVLLWLPLVCCDALITDCFRKICARPWLIVAVAAYLSGLHLLNIVGLHEALTYGSHIF